MPKVSKYACDNGCGEDTLTENPKDARYEYYMVSVRIPSTGETDTGWVCSLTCAQEFFTKATADWSSL